MDIVRLFNKNEILKLIDIYKEVFGSDFGIELIEKYIDEFNQINYNVIGKMLVGILQDYVGVKVINFENILNNDLDFDEDLEDDIYENNVSGDIAIQSSRITSINSPIKRKFIELKNRLIKKGQKPDVIKNVLYKNNLSDKNKKFLETIIKRLSLVGGI